LPSASAIRAGAAFIEISVDDNKRTGGLQAIRVAGRAFFYSHSLFTAEAGFPARR
jgi:hypothetical protein